MATGHPPAYHAPTDLTRRYTAESPELHALSPPQNKRIAQHRNRLPMLVNHRGLPHHEAHGPGPTGFFVHIDQAGGVDERVSRIDYAVKGARIAGVDARPLKTHLRWGDGMCPA